MTRRFCVLLLTLLIVLFAALMPAQARVVGIMFDDSGSMSPRIHLPTFGAQLLVSTLDGRQGKDRLFTVRISQLLRAKGDGRRLLVLPAGGVDASNIAQWLQSAHGAPFTVENLTTQALQQQTLDMIRHDWPHAEVSTPYEPIEVMLAELVQDVHEGEEAYLVIITDGGLNTAPDLVRLRNSYTQYKARLAAKRASLRVDFALIAVGDEPGVKEEVERQGVRDLLLDMFNGEHVTGSHVITSLDTLVAKLKTVIARVSSTDPAGQGHYVSAAQNSISIDSPLSITRLVTVATATRPTEPARLQTEPVNVVDERRLNTAMLSADQLLPGQVLTGETVQLRFQPALAPGVYRLGFDRPVGNDVFALFETGAYVDLNVLSVDGTPVRREGDTFLLAKDKAYQLEARLYDMREGKPVEVQLSKLTGRSDFTAAIDDSNGRQNLALSVDAPGNRALGPLTASTLGVMSARAQVRLDGYVSPRSNPVQIRVVDSAASFETEIRSIETCTGCPPNTIKVTLGGEARPRKIGTIVFIPKLTTKGTATLDLSGLPLWLSVSDAAGRVLKNGDHLAVTDGAPVTLDLGTKGDLTNIVGTPAFQIGLAAEAPLQGGGTAAGTIALQVPAARLTFTSHSAGDPTIPLRLTGADLRSGAFALDFSLDGSLSRPEAAEFTVKSTTGLVHYDIDVRDYTIHLHPSTRLWCLCLLGWLDPQPQIEIAWHRAGGLQSAQAAAGYEIAPTTMEMISSCGLLLGLLLALIWVVLAVLTWMRTRRFPRHSVAEISEGRQIPRYVDLRGRNWTFCRSLLPWRAWRLQSPHEMKAIEGIMFEATGSGASILLGRTTIEFIVLRLGQSSRELLETNPKLITIRVIWNDEIEPLSGERITIKILNKMPATV